jgi:hypothetical protein
MLCSFHGASGEFGEPRIVFHRAPNQTLERTVADLSRRLAEDDLAIYAFDQ